MKSTDVPSPADDDRTLLGRYAQQGSAAAFSELVRRHVDAVYSAALRRVNGDHALAEDVTQTVFADFARQAARIEIPAGGWLHRHTGFVAAKMTGKERRRRAREQEAMNPTLTHTHDPEWQSTAPLLDAALDTLSSSDRDAIVLRFFEQQDFRSVGAALGMSDDSAQKKVSRALEKLRGALSRRGIASTGGALAALLAANTVGAAPAALAGRMATQSLAAAASAGGTLSGAFTGLSAGARWKGAAAVVALMTAAAFTGSVVQRRNFHKISPTAPKPSAAVAAGVPSTAAPATAAVPVPEPAMDVAAIIDAAAAEWRGGRETVAGSAKALAFLSRIRAEEIRDALSKTAVLTDKPARWLVTKHLVNLWTSFDAPAALQWASSDAAGSRRAELRSGVLNAWAAENPQAAMGWGSKVTAAQQQPDHSVLATAYRSFAASQPNDALQQMRFLATPVERDLALRGILESVHSDEDRVRLSGFIAAIPEPEVRIQARRALVEQWAARDIKAAAAYVEKAEPAWERTRLMDSLGYSWLQSNAPAAAAWWAGHAPGADTLVKIINVWAQQDPDAAGRWLDAQPRGAQSDTARMTFARQVADLDPESALQWATTVSDAAVSEGTIDHIFKSWHARDPASASAFLQTSNWPAERKARQPQ